MECPLWRTVGDGGNFEVVCSALCGAEALSAGLSCSETICWCFIHFLVRVKYVRVHKHVRKEKEPSFIFYY